jgi:hypothetical protein
MKLVSQSVLGSVKANYLPTSKLAATYELRPIHVHPNKA